MNLKHALAMAVISLSAATAAQAQVTVFNSAFLQPLPPGIGNEGEVSMFGFGRNTSLLGAQADRLQAPQGSTTLLPYFDTWNIGTSSVAPGIYNFSSLRVEAEGTALFTGVTFNSFDAQGVRNTILFNLNAAGTVAVGSGSFTVLASCPVANCVWIDVIGQRPAGTPWGYGGTISALPVPEPGQWALLALGLAAMAGVVRRRRSAQA